MSKEDMLRLNKKIIMSNTNANETTDINKGIKIKCSIQRGINKGIKRKHHSNSGIKLIRIF